MHAVDRGVSCAEGDRGGGEALFALGEAGRGAARFGATLAGKVFQRTTGMIWGGINPWLLSFDICIYVKPIIEQL